ncbi:helix-turn-helix transcriptional regulator [Streptomyces sp. MB09-02B]|uniref:helix-turn-helix domain-containing protein n=1 Tax=Streptomyces sp. MB09-02B TaxID=3028667 RepID=UPI0029A730F5|nr:helix-turn-helix transcriptional regulator [Streptomyces sp. MB09-02B]MDX3641413.1 helix-turn-helix transcriptional regulator [Streptomyces sp. MB09-02B]
MPSDTSPDGLVDRLRAVGANIRAAREAQKLSLEDLGRATGLGPSRIDQVERGVDDMSLDDLLLISYVLDVALAELVAD